MSRDEASDVRSGRVTKRCSSSVAWYYNPTNGRDCLEGTNSISKSALARGHIVNRSMWMGRHQERHTAIFVPLGEETGLASCPVWWGKVYVAWIISLLLPGKHILLSDHDAAPTALFEVADLQQLCVTESDFRLAAGEFPSDTIWDFAPAATRTPTPRHDMRFLSALSSCRSLPRMHKAV